MNNCKDCQFWEEREYGFGKCSKLAVADFFGTHHRIERRICFQQSELAGHPITTVSWFGCVNFEKRQSYPFTWGMRVSDTGYRIFHEALGEEIQLELSECDAKALAAWLNEIWKREERRIQCDNQQLPNRDNCGTYAQCANILCPCARWSKKE